jgi:hypothetical protein
MTRAWRYAVILLLLFFAGGPVSTDPAVETRNEGYLPEPPEVYDRIPVSDSAFMRHRGLPSRVDLTQYFPPAG